LPNIFHPFYTTKGVGVGTGLGLYISYEIVKKHGGDIIVDTAPGQGTEFRVELPSISATG
jgi:two-component system NtrC family sensor kinase